MRGSLLGMIFVLVAGTASAGAAPACNSTGGLEFCVVDASVRTHRTFSKGNQEVIASLQFDVTNESEADASISLAGKSAAIIINGVTINDLAHQTGVLGIKVGDEPGDFVTFGAKQTQTISFTFRQNLNLNSVGPVARGEDGRFSAILHLADAKGKRDVSLSVSGFRLRNEVRLQ